MPSQPQNNYSICFTTLKIAPTGTGTWNYYWEVSDSLSGPYTALPGETDSSLALFVDQLGVTRYYRGTAWRSGETAYVVALYRSGLSGTTPSLVTLEEKSLANLDITHSAGVGTGPWEFQWYFVPSGGAEQLIPGAVGSQYTIEAADCPKRGMYRVSAIDGCNESFIRPYGDRVELDVINCP